MAPRLLLLVAALLAAPALASAKQYQVRSAPTRAARATLRQLRARTDTDAFRPSVRHKKYFDNTYISDGEYLARTWTTEEGCLQACEARSDCAAAYFGVDWSGECSLVGASYVNLLYQRYGSMSSFSPSARHTYVDVASSAYVAQSYATFKNFQNGVITAVQLSSPPPPPPSTPPSTPPSSPPTATTPPAPAATVRVVLDDFESGSLAGWSVNGDAGVSSGADLGVAPYTGSNLAFVHAGCPAQASSMSKTFPLGADAERISLVFAFRCNEGSEFNDNMHVAVSDADTGAVYGTADLDCNSVGYYNTPAWVHRTFELPGSVKGADQAFTLRIEGSSTNDQDCQVASTLLLDSITVDDVAGPLPPALLAAGRRYVLNPSTFADSNHVLLDVDELGSMQATLATSTLGLGGFTFDGLPSDDGEGGVTVLLRHAPAEGAAITVSLVATYTQDAGSEFSDGRYRHLFALGGLTAVLHNSTLFVGNVLGGAVDCGAAADLAGGARGAPAWRGGESRNVTVVVSAEGTPSIMIDGEPAVEPQAAPEAHPAPGCAPPIVPVDTTLRIGVSGNALFDDNFHGLISEVAFSFN
jgi:hypothetical protein